MSKFLGLVACLLAVSSISTVQGFLLSPAAHRVLMLRGTAMTSSSARHTRSLGAGGLAMQKGGGNKEKWSADVQDEDAERIESGKVAVASAISGSIISGPLALLIPGEFSAAGAPFSPLWEFQVDALAVMLALFGLVYRYAVRNDPNPQLKQGVVGAFAITRTLALLNPGPDCTAIPLQCGPPLGYLSLDMIKQLAGAGAESAVAFGAAALVIELLFSKGILQRFPGGRS